MVREDWAYDVVKGGGLLTEASVQPIYHTHNCVLQNPKGNLHQDASMYYF